jgi:hypothetical protein
MAEIVTSDDVLLKLLEIEGRIGRVGNWNIYERWSSGRYLIGLRSAETNYLPKGRLTNVAATLKVSTRELSDRMRVADAFRTATEFKKAATRCGNVWTTLLRSLPPTREARTGSTRPPKAWRRILYEALAHVLDNRLIDRQGLQLARKLYDHLEATGEE